MSSSICPNPVTSPSSAQPCAGRGGTHKSRMKIRNVTATTTTTTTTGRTNTVKKKKTETKFLLFCRHHRASALWFLLCGSVLCRSVSAFLKHYTQNREKNRAEEKIGGGDGGKNFYKNVPAGEAHIHRCTHTHTLTHKCWWVGWLWCWWWGEEVEQEVILSPLVFLQSATQRNPGRMSCFGARQWRRWGIVPWQLLSF